MPKSRKIKFSQHLRISSYALIIFAVVIFLATHKTPPLKNELIVAHGEALNIKEIRGKYGGTGFSFSLSTDSKKYVFTAYGIDYENILSELRKSHRVAVRILTSKSGNKYELSQEKTFPVYEIKIDNGQEITYEKLSKSWEKSRISTMSYAALGVAIGLFLIIATFLSVRHQPN
ncbi:hypothetical protein [Aquipseudomonas alcaligenes]|uniref:DUF3592 domain-containing protein n=1 Tax=Aquipseudomonas alcaligenes (strain ATCC 14909 / DSM 50342 / CCUG 1425 / JCM 20561 / NBRC 14159 / NCIMB 9945 / NCTC 10367 / 1577) TaxID=1215092 RepID=U2ZB46_AQUA1|nr:hypothetical protein [Pseudomonas alcaligenes]GAD64936.1 hypothetical protein PA6_054_00200 [Pseudomonas alcaligenes NBRC 14159]